MLTDERKSNELTMNSLRSRNWAVWIALASMLATASTGLAAGSNAAVGHPVKSRKEAEQLPPGSKVTLACAKCKTGWNTEVGKKKGFLAWFEPRPNISVLAVGGIRRCLPMGTQSSGTGSFMVAIIPIILIHVQSVAPTPLLATRTRPDTRSSRQPCEDLVRRRKRSQKARLLL